MKKMFVFAKGCVLGLALMLCGQGAFADSLGMGQGLGETAFNITLAVENQPCAPLRNGDIGMSADGLLLSCQSGKWASTSSSLTNDHAMSPLIHHWSGADFLTRCPAGYVVTGLHAWAGGSATYTRVDSAFCTRLR